MSARKSFQSANCILNIAEFPCEICEFLFQMHIEINVVIFELLCEICVMSNNDTKCMSSDMVGSVVLQKVTHVSEVLSVSIFREMITVNALMMEAAGTAETSINVYQATRITHQ
jgi:hypothetical protein